LWLSREGGDLGWKPEEEGLAPTGIAYPEFGRDHLAGAVNQPHLVKRILEEGHEISNHGYRHMAFGTHRIIYGSRAHFNTIKEVSEDLGDFMLSSGTGSTIP